MAAEYPKRPQFFANKFVRLMAKTCAAQEMGSNAFVLCTVIAQTEDAKRYRGAVTYFNGQLMPICGFGSLKALMNARQKAIDAGWLNYIPGGKSVPGKYWVSIPEHAKGLDDSPIDEGDQSELQTDTQKATVKGSDEESKGNQSATQEQLIGNSRANHSSYTLNPPPPPPKEIDSGKADWAAAEDVLIDYPVDAPGAAITEARKRGYTPDQVIAIVAFAKSREPAYGGGAVFERIRSGSPKQPPDKGWPPESKKAKQAREAKSREEESAAKKAKAEQDKQEREARARERKRLESEFGGRLDEIPPEKLDQLAARALGGTKSPAYKAYRRNPGNYRFELLRQFAFEDIPDNGRSPPG